MAVHTTSTTTAFSVVVAPAEGSLDLLCVLLQLLQLLLRQLGLLDASVRPFYSFPAVNVN